MLVNTKALVDGLEVFIVVKRGELPNAFFLWEKGNDFASL
jgi:hypothetical protein